MSLVCGAKAKYPCPVCLVFFKNQRKSIGTYILQTQEASQRLVEKAMQLAAGPAEDILKKESLYKVYVRLLSLVFRRLIEHY